jgi:nucleoside-diphosphate-sugar epimerase
MNNDNSVLTQTSTVLVDGATGYIGSHLVNALTQSLGQNIKTRCLVRKNAHKTDVDYLKKSGAELFEADLADSGIDDIFSQVDIAYHLIGSIAPKKGETSTSLHVGQTEKFVQQCLKNKVKKIIMVSACGADPTAKSEYHRTKWQAERKILESGISSIILRPSLVIGKTQGMRNSKLITRLEHLIRNKKSVPLIAGGINKLQPIFIQDLIEAILACSNPSRNPKTDETIMELGGPEIITLRELVQKMMTLLNMQRPILSLPIPVASIAAHLALLFQEIPIISPDQIKITQQDNICHNNKLESLITKNPTNVDHALNSYNWKS